MPVFREEDEGGEFGQDALVFALGAAGGFVLGMLLSGRGKSQPFGSIGAGLRDRARGMAGDMGTGLRDRARTVGDRARSVGGRARSAAASIRPGHLRRRLGENSALETLEDSVLDAFLGDDVLSERGIDVGAISRGIIELSGYVESEDEGDRAVRLAQSVAGVETVVNRLEVEDELRRVERTRTRVGEGDDGVSETEWTGRNVGMGRRRQGAETDPDRSDDSQHQREVALEHADRSQFEDEGHTSRPRTAARREVSSGTKSTKYREDQLDNQSPYGKNAPVNVPEQPQDFNSAARVGEGLKPGTELALEAADVPVKPHSKNAQHERGEV